MKNRFRIRVLSVLVSLILAVSVPLCAYADSNEIIPEQTAEEDLVPSDGDLIIEDEDLEDDSSNDADIPSDLYDQPEDILEKADDAEEDPSAPEPEEDEDASPIADPEDTAVKGDDFEAEGSIEAAREKDVEATGSCGANAKWEVYYDYDSYQYVLSITGTGAIKDYDDINQSPFAGFWLDKIIIGSGITAIGKRAFYCADAATVVIQGNTLKEIRDEAFRGSYVETINIPEGVTSIGERAFYGSNLQSVLLPSTLQTIGAYAFYASAFYQITIPDSVTSIGEGALYSCTSIYYSKGAAQWELNGWNNAIDTEDAAIYGISSLSGAEVTLSGTSFVYTGALIKPTVQVVLGSKTLTEGTDYNVTYKKNKSVGTATVTVTGIYGYKGSVNKTFTITKRKLSQTVITGIKSVAYTGKSIKLKLAVKVKTASGYVTLKNGTDYTVKYSNNKKVSTSKAPAVVTITGKGNVTGTVKKTFKIVKASIKNAGVYGVYSKYYYTGSTIKPDEMVYLYIGNKYVKLKKGRDYTVKYTNCKNVTSSKSKATIKITGKGNYKGSVTASFKIVKRNSDAIVQRARKWVGKAKYEYCACREGAFDCSGFVSYCITGKYVRVGSSYDFCNLPRVKNPKPGDIAARPGHVGIYIGNGMMIDAADERLGVRIAAVPGDMYFVREPGPLI